MRHLRTNRFDVSVAPAESLVKSIKEQGILVPIQCNPNFKIIDGDHRVACAKILSIKIVPVIVRNMSNEEVDEYRAVRFRIATNPVMYRAALIAIGRHNPDLTVAEFAAKLNIDIPRLLGKLWTS